MDTSCSIADCKRATAGSLGPRAFCREHFISTCYERIEECAQRLEEGRFSDATSEPMGRLLSECAAQVTTLALDTPDLSNLERAQLLDILGWATDLTRRLRRSPRRMAVIPVRLHCEAPGRIWQEETKTLMLSRHGALLECRHPVEAGDTLLVVRTDTDQRAQARVVWRQPAGSGRVEMAVEFLDRDNFWDMDWNSAEPAP